MSWRHNPGLVLPSRGRQSLIGPKNIKSYLVDVTVFESVELLPHRLEVHRPLDVAQVIRNFVHVDGFRENPVGIDFLEIV